LAELAVAITDKQHPEYERIARNLLSSNPRGFASWFEDRARPWALARIGSLVEQRFYASVEVVPPYEWKTLLQRAIQLLKRHRDVMFRNNPETDPISMIITNLAAHAYAGEADLFSAVVNIVEKMPQYVRPARPRVPNPADPAEDYADKWAKHPILETNFWVWHAQVKADIGRIPSFLTSNRLFSNVRSVFQVELTAEKLKRFAVPTVQRSSYASGGPILSIPAAPKPWGHHG
jgi:hypothetical protein